MMNIYVGNLPYSVKSQDLREAFEAYGAVASAEVIFDRRTKRSRGYGFVEMASEQEGLRAIAALNGADFKGRELRVDQSQPREDKPERPTTAAGQPATQRAPRATVTVEKAPPPSSGGVFGFVKKLFG